MASIIMLKFDLTFFPQPTRHMDGLGGSFPAGSGGGAPVAQMHFGVGSHLQHQIKWAALVSNFHDTCFHFTRQKFDEKIFIGGRVSLGVIGPQSKKFPSPVIGDTEDYPWEKFERTCSVKIATMCLQVTENVRKRRCGGYRPPSSKITIFPAFT